MWDTRGMRRNVNQTQERLPFGGLVGKSVKVVFVEERYGLDVCAPSKFVC